VTGLVADICRNTMYAVAHCTKVVLGHTRLFLSGMFDLILLSVLDSVPSSESLIFQDFQSFA